jgi:hemolysin-activating ACP:hemolysin acyltransferase
MLWCIVGLYISVMMVQLQFMSVSACVFRGYEVTKWLVQLFSSITQIQHKITSRVNRPVVCNICYNV